MGENPQFGELGLLLHWENYASTEREREDPTEKHRSRFIKSWQESADSISRWDEGNSRVYALFLIRRCAWRLDDCLGRHNGAQRKQSLGLSRHCFEIEACKGSLALPVRRVHNLIEWSTVKRCPRRQKLSDIMSFTRKHNGCDAMDHWAMRKSWRGLMCSCP